MEVALELDEEKTGAGGRVYIGRRPGCNTERLIQWGPRAYAAVRWLRDVFFLPRTAQRVCLGIGARARSGSQRTTSELLLLHMSWPCTNSRNVTMGK